MYLIGTTLTVIKRRTSLRHYIVQADCEATSEFANLPSSNSSHRTSPTQSIIIDYK